MDLWDKTDSLSYVWRSIDFKNRIYVLQGSYMSRIKVNYLCKLDVHRSNLPASQVGNASQPLLSLLHNTTESPTRPYPLLQLNVASKLVVVWTSVKTPFVIVGSSQSALKKSITYQSYVLVHWFYENILNKLWWKFQ